MTPLEHAGEAWREGRILEAQREYRTITKTDPDQWGAWFQLAWLDGAFARLTMAAVQALKRPGLCESARNMIQALEGMVEFPRPLQGGIEDWDIGALHRLGDAETYSSWWEARGKSAAKAGLYSVALACFEEAESREPSGAYWDPPAWSHSLPAQVEGHLELAAHPFETGM